MSTPSNPNSTHDTPSPFPNRPRKAPDVTDELLPDGTMVLFNAGRQELRTLNGTAALVWECCDGAHNLDAIIAEVREVFPDQPSIADDVRAALREFQTHGLLAEESASS